MQNFENAIVERNRQIKLLMKVFKISYATAAQFRYAIIKDQK